MLLELDTVDYFHIDNCLVDDHISLTHNGAPGGYSASGPPLWTLIQFPRYRAHPDDPPWLRALHYTSSALLRLR